MMALIGYSGFTTGGTIFRMSDVNLLFVSPTKPQSILWAGLVQQMGTAFLMGFFILFQYGWMYGVYGVSPASIVWIMIGYICTVLSAQMFAMMAYSLTVSRPKQRSLLKGLFIAVLVGFAAAILFGAYQTGEFSIASVAYSASKIGKWLPVAGWMSAAFTAMVGGAYLEAAAWFAATVALLGVGATVFMRSDPDYYEDVIKTAEKFQTAVAAQREGITQDAAPDNVKVGKNGLAGGMGASAFYYKHLIENRRTRSSLIGMQQLIFVVVSVVYSFIMMRTMDGDVQAGLIATLAFSFYMQLFSSSFGRLPIELAKPFVYLVPEPPAAKLLACLRESAPKMLIESLLTMVPISLIYSLDVPQGALLVLLKLSWSVLLLGANLVHSRVFGFRRSKGLSMLFYLVVAIVLALPGIGAGIGSIALFGGGLNAFCIGMTAVDFVIGAVVVLLCRNILNNAECNA